MNYTGRAKINYGAARHNRNAAKSLSAREDLKKSAVAGPGETVSTKVSNDALEATLQEGPSKEVHLSTRYGSRPTVPKTAENGYSKATPGRAKGTRYSNAKTTRDTAKDIPAKAATMGNKAVDETLSR